MSRLIRGAALGTAILQSAAACTDAGAEGNGTLRFRDLESGDTKTVARFPRMADSCLTPAFAPGTGGELLVPGGDEVTIHYPEEVEVGNVYADGGQVVQVGHVRLPSVVGTRSRS